MLAPVFTNGREVRLEGGFRNTDGRRDFRNAANINDSEQHAQLGGRQEQSDVRGSAQPKPGYRFANPGYAC